MSPQEHDKFRHQVEDLLRKGHVRESLSPTAVHVLLIPRKDGTLRMCVDSRVINKITVCYHCPMPCLDDLLDQIGRSSVFSKLDLKTGYHQIRIQRGDDTFMRVMNQASCPFIGKFVVVYFDDIIVFSSEISSHLDHLKVVLLVLRQEKLYAAQHNKVAAPLNDFMKIMSFVWTAAANEAFESLKENLTTTQILALPDFFYEKIAGSRARYSTYDVEFYAIVQAIKHWCHYLFHQEFVLCTNQDALKTNKVANALSRRHTLFATLQVSVLGFASFTELYVSDPFLIWADISARIASDYLIPDGFLFLASRLCIPERSWRLKIIKECHEEGHVGRDITLQLVK
ncbi:LOW QUALITY PROTEIN: hypothetical protein N665_0336s0005 [Sinapis alba]|nr:LOW QUALITY PROTEIN: hypothetical protein N665_0336s0005 [Sinapis alba]